MQHDTKTRESSLPGTMYVPRNADNKRRAPQRGDAGSDILDDLFRM